MKNNTELKKNIQASFLKVKTDFSTLREHILTVAQGQQDYTVILKQISQAVVKIEKKIERLETQLQQHKKELQKNHTYHKMIKKMQKTRNSRTK